MQGNFVYQHRNVRLVILALVCQVVFGVSLPQSGALSKGQESLGFKKSAGKPSEILPTIQIHDVSSLDKNMPATQLSTNENHQDTQDVLPVNNWLIDDQWYLPESNTDDEYKDYSHFLERKLPTSFIGNKPEGEYLNPVYALENGNSNQVFVTAPSIGHSGIQDKVPDIDTVKSYLKVKGHYDPLEDILHEKLWKNSNSNEREFPVQSNGDLADHGLSESDVGEESGKDLAKDTVDNEKLFLVGLQRFVRPVNKRFMRGFNDYDKRFLRGFNSYDKRFLRGFNGYDKRFMRGFNGYDKRFMRGFNGYDKRFMRGFNGYDKRFMRGFNGYDKRFMRGFNGYDKRFMRGLVKRDDRKAKQDLKVFTLDIIENSTTNKDLKQFPQTFINENEASEGFDVPSRENKDVKRFMRGFIRRSENSGDFEKRFMRGLVKKSDIDEKRFMRGLVKKSDNELQEMSSNRQISVDEISNEGVEKKQTANEEWPSRETVNDNVDEGNLLAVSDKRFIKGFNNYAKRDNEITNNDINEEDKRFMRGLVKKENSNAIEEDKRFMKGLVKKEDSNAIEEDKRFMRGLVKKEVSNAIEEDKRFMRGLVKKEDSNAIEEDKRFMRGLVKKENIDFTEDKRFMRGLVKKEDTHKENTKDKRFIKRLV